jgi:hypothetical protein
MPIQHPIFKTGQQENKLQIGTLHSNNKSKAGWIISLIAAGCFLLVFAWSSRLLAGTSAVSLNTWFVDMDRYEAAVHSSLECEECHGPMIGKIAGKNTKHPDPKAIDSLKTEAKRNFDYQLCKNCHESEHESFLKGEHAKAAMEENESSKPSETEFAPTCGDCHSAHYP